MHFTPGILDALGRNDGEEKRARGEIRRTWRVLRRGGPHREDGVWKRPGGERRSGREHVPVRLSSGRLALDAVEQRRHERRRDSRVGQRVLEETQKGRRGVELRHER